MIIRVFICLFLLILIICIASQKNSINGGMEILNDTYSEYLKIHKLKSLGRQLDNKKKYELHNSIERYLISAYPDFINNAALKKLADELKHQKINLYNQVLKILEEPFEKTPKGLQLKIIKMEDKVHIKYGLFETDIPKYRYDILKKFGSDEDILEVCLVYSRILFGSQHWAIPLDKFKEYVEQGASIEGFASPFNSQIMRIDKPGLHYCSLMEIDKKFGSLGDFFDQDFSNKFVVVNPPFIESVLKRAAEKCLSEKGKFVFYGPNWTDAEFYTLLEAAGAKKEILKKGEHEYEDLLHDRRVVARFESVVFTFGEIHI